jgi:hypothetical protein
VKKKVFDRNDDLVKKIGVQYGIDLLDRTHSFSISGNLIGGGVIGAYIFDIYFLYGIYIFIEDLLGFINCISDSAHPRRHILQSYITFISKCIWDLLKNSNKPLKNKSR